MTPLGKGHSGQSKPARRVLANLLSPGRTPKLTAAGAKLYSNVPPPPDVKTNKPAPKIRPQRVLKGVGPKPRSKAQHYPGTPPPKRHRVHKQRQESVDILPSPQKGVPDLKPPSPVKPPSPIKPPSPARPPSPVKTPVAEAPPVPPSPVYNYNSFRKAHAGNKWTPRKMGAEWQAWKQAHPNK